MIKKKPIKLSLTYNIYSLAELNRVIKGLSKGFKDPLIEFELNWDGCYYEGDYPTIDLVVREAQVLGDKG